MKTLSAKEKKAIEGIMMGLNKRRAVYRAYDCKTLFSADIIAQKLFKKEKVIRKLDELTRKVEDTLIPKAQRNIERILDAYEGQKLKVSPGIYARASLEVMKMGEERAKEGKTKIEKKVEFIQQFMVPEKNKELTEPEKNA